MHFIGYLVYLAVLASYFLVNKVHEQISMAYDLATEIVMGCFIMGIFPLVVFLFFHIKGARSLRYKQTFTTINNACSSVVVSLGLIGTFVGLTDMISQIAGAVGAKGGSVEDQIGTIMVAIGGSLESMSFAFLTSVMGVAGSVIVLLAGVCFREFFDPDDADSSGDLELDSDALAKLGSDNNTIKMYINKLISGAVDRNEMASIQITNSKQVGELSLLVSKLTGIYNEEARKNDILSEKITGQDVLISELIKCNQVTQEFLAGIYENSEKSVKLVDLTEGSQELLNGILENTLQGVAISREATDLARQDMDSKKKIFSSLSV